MAAITVAILEAYARLPQVIAALDRAIHRGATTLASAVSTLIATIGWAILVLPTWAIARVARYSPLDLGWATPATAWTDVDTSRTRSPDHRPLEPRRLSCRDLLPTAKVRRRNLLRPVLLVVIGVAAHIPMLLQRGASAVGHTVTAVSDVRALEDSPDKDIRWSGLRVVGYSHENQPWIADLFRETIRANNVHDLMLGARNRDFSGRYLNIADGVRASYTPDRPTLTVWFFGGSTMYGIGQRDDHTIPSEFARAAERDGVAVRSLNFGVNGDANWQETIRFAEALQSGCDTPDLVVFYDGWNDQSVGQYRADIGNLDPNKMERLAFSDADRTQHRAAFGNQDPMPYGSKRTEIEIKLAAEQYRRGVETGRTIAAGHNIPVVDVWQPFAPTKKPSPADAELYRLIGFDPASRPR